VKIKSVLVRNLADEVETFINAIPNFSFGGSDGEYCINNRFPDLSIVELRKKTVESEPYFLRIQDLKKDSSLSNYDILALEELEAILKSRIFATYTPIKEEFYYLSFDITPFSFPLFFGWQGMSTLPCDTKENVKKHMELFSDYPRFMKQLKTKVEEQAAKGIYLYAEAISGAIKNLKKYAVEPQNHPGYMGREGSVATKEEIAAEDLCYIEAKKYLLEIVAFISSDEYKAKAPKGIGLLQYDGGLEYYRFLREFYIGYDLSAKELHEIGKRALEKTCLKQEEIRTALGFEGSHEDFIRSLRKNERFFPKSAEKVSELLNKFVDDYKKALPKYFHKIPKTPFKIERLPLELEGVMAFGFYEDSNKNQNEGIYYFNGSGLGEKCQITMPALMAHELCHHIQLCTSQEDSELHSLFKKNVSISFLYGWAGYGELLFEEEGLFSDLYDIYGSLETEKFICTRLIVDTALNEIGWKRGDAKDFMLLHTYITPEMADAEILRYATDFNAQCLPYKFGRLKMIEIRDRYKAAKGKSFNIKDFNELVLGVGSVPLNILEKYIDREIDKSKAKV